LFDRISMNVILVLQEVSFVANAVIRESALPDFTRAADRRPQSVRISAFDELDGMFDGYIVSGSDQKVDVLGHDDESVELKPAFTSVSIERLQKEADVVFDHEQTPTLPRGESDEIRSGRGDESSRLQERTSAAKAAIFA
jgi:hypothetical protein